MQCTIKLPQSKNIDRDEKRSLSRLTLIAETPICYEVTTSKEGGYERATTLTGGRTLSAGSAHVSSLNPRPQANINKSAPSSPKSAHSSHSNANKTRKSLTHQDCYPKLKLNRDATLRLSLEPGNYLLVPYTYQPSHEGQFLCTVLVEKENPTLKSGWLVYS